jgi:hypothetical protein
MKPIPSDLYERIERVTETVRLNFLKRGIVIPTKNSDGSISLGRFRVVNQHTGFYAVYNNKNEIVVDQINLPQTAALVANDLALGKFLDYDIVQKDKKYGYALFEEMLYDQRLKNTKRDLSSFEISLTKSKKFKNLRQEYEKTIITRFEKLRKLA